MDATLQEILENREWRAKRQKELIVQYQKPLLCFTMNIAGPDKWNRDVSIGFAVGNLLLRQMLKSVVHYECHYDCAGCSAFYVADMPAAQLKSIAIEVEHTEHIGRLFDMDVLDAEGKKISREELGYPPRKCLICQEDARLCARRRNHGLDAIRQKTQQLLNEAAQWLAEYIAVSAYFALNQEVNTTPKPGLVDRNNNGAHRDMGLRHFFASSNALRPYFYQFAEAGMHTRDSKPDNTFVRIRQIGIEAEQAMYSATGGVNTHKGAIFSMGLLCAAAGRLPPHMWKAELLLGECAAMANDLVKKDFAGTTIEGAKTVGEELYTKYGITGVRGQAEAGFPAVKTIGLPIYKEAIRQGLSENHAGCITLLHLIASTDDTNLIHRSTRQKQLEIQRQIRGMLEKDTFPKLETIAELDKTFIANNLSPGGSADLLAMTYFLYNIERTL